MSSEIIKVAILGAAGESAGRILNGLLESKSPTYVCLVRPTMCGTTAAEQEATSADKDRAENNSMA